LSNSEEVTASETNDSGSQGKNGDSHPLMTVTQIEKEYDFKILDHVQKSEEIYPDSVFSVMTPDNFDLSQVGIKKHVPKTK
jgi:hypothetical protein